MDIRKAEPEDLPTIAKLTRDFVGYLMKLEGDTDTPLPEVEKLLTVLKEGADDPKHRIFVVTEGSRIVGFCDFWMYPEFLHGGNIAYLNNIYVEEQMRSKGAGSGLLSRVLEECRDEGVKAIHVPVKASNTSAISFYKRHGITDELLMLETRLDKEEV